MDPLSAPAPATAQRDVPALPAQQLTSTSKKRNHQGEIVNHVNSVVTPPVDQQSSPLTANQSRSGSPALSDASTPLTDLGATPTLSPAQVTMPPASSKKAKLSFAEREAEKALKKQEKEEKERQKAEVKAKKEEERVKKEEEKEIARKAKEDKKKQRDAEKQEREAERERKAAEVIKKERAQLRIGAFFGRPSPSATPPATPDDVSVGTSSRRASIISIDIEPPLVETKKLKPTNLEYSNWILPFFVNEHMELAPFNRFRTADPFDDKQLPLNQNAITEKINTRFRKRRRARPVKPVKEILEQMNGSEGTPVDVSSDPLAHVPYKYFFFREDIRPAYQGTYTRVVSPRTARRIAVNPSHRGLPDTDYDYDSEAEWQEPEEGDDDLMDEDEKSEDEDADEEMDDFLDDEGEVAKRQMIVGDMEPKSSGLCWEGENVQPQDGSDLSVYRMDVLHDSTTLPIDPYSTTHWSDIGKPSPKKRETKAQQSSADVSMQPPRIPLVAVDGNGGNIIPVSSLLHFATGNSQSENKMPNSKLKSYSGAGPGKPVKMIPTDLLPAFKDAVSGSTLTKTGLVEVLKNTFPKCSKDAIKGTLESVAVRKGAKESEKKWVLND